MLPTSTKPIGCFSCIDELDKCMGVRREPDAKTGHGESQLVDDVISVA